MADLYDFHIRHATRVICPDCGKQYDVQNPPATWVRCVICTEAHRKAGQA